MRLLAGILAGQPFDSAITGDDSLRRRPMQRIVDPLERMGARIGTTDGRPPLTIRGTPLRGVSYETPVASAQVKSAALLAGLHAAGTTRITETHPDSRSHRTRAARLRRPDRPDGGRRGGRRRPAPAAGRRAGARRPVVGGVLGGGRGGAARLGHRDRRRRAQPHAHGVSRRARGSGRRRRGRARRHGRGRALRHGTGAPPHAAADARRGAAGARVDRRAARAGGAGGARRHAARERRRRAAGQGERPHRGAGGGSCARWAAPWTSGRTASACARPG